MAYQAKQRDPLFDSSMQAAIERRGHELLGLCLFGIGAALAAMLGTYSPDDPSFFSATDSPVQNLFGTFGASVAGPLYIVVGHGCWALAVVAMAWGVRLMAHVGTERITTRILLAPLAVALAAVYASTLAPGPEWVHIFGLGGLFGDTILGALLNILPVPPGAGVRILSAPLGLGALALALVSAGFTYAEVRRLAGLAMVGIVLTYDRLLRFAALSAGGAGGIARSVAGGLSERGAARAERRAARRAEAQAAAHLAMEAAPVGAPGSRNRVRHQPMPHDAPEFVVEPLDQAGDAPAPRRGLLSAVKSLVRRQPAGDGGDAVYQPGAEGAPAAASHAHTAPEDRVRARIADAIRSRASQNRPVQPEPIPGDFRPSPLVAADALGRAEPPLVRAHRQNLAQNPALLRVPGAVPTAPMAQLDEMEMPDMGYAPEYPEEMDAQDEDDTGVAFDSLPSEDLPGGARMLDRRPIPVAEQKAVVQHPPRRPPPPSRKAKAEAQPRLKLEPEAEAYETPPLALLTNPESVERHVLSDEALEENARMLESVLDDYGVKGEIVSVRPGPVVTLYELEPAPGLKASRVIGLADDIARSMSALAARVSTVPGRSVIGIELPNANREKVVLREILSARDYGDANMKLPLALGKDISGGPVVANLAKMPHLLIAGTTGSGKSVAINTMILSLLYRLSPAECRLIMIDPKMLELSVYDGIPHLLSPVVTDPKKAVVALKWVVAEMEERYRKMSKMGVRNIEGYNGRVHDALSRDEMFSRTVQTGFDEETGDPIFETEEFAPEALPYIVVIVDEMADLMMVAGKEIEACIQRLAQMARASGIHLIMATQRPSVDVITGTIKANFPTRISFQVTSKIDSRTILGEMGAEQLLGMGDMLYMAGGSKITRVHGPFCSDEEVEEVVRHLKSYGPPEYVQNVLDGPDEENAADIDAVLGLGGNTDGEDALYDQAVGIVARDRKCSTSYIQRKLAIGYNKAARLVEQMEDNGVVGPSNSVGKREILVPEVQ